jgi:hypothetical protein
MLLLALRLLRPPSQFRQAARALRDGSSDPVVRALQLTSMATHAHDPTACVPVRAPLACIAWMVRSISLFQDHAVLAKEAPLSGLFA